MGLHKEFQLFLRLNEKQKEDEVYVSKCIKILAMHSFQESFPYPRGCNTGTSGYQCEWAH